MEYMKLHWQEANLLESNLILSIWMVINYSSEVIWNYYFVRCCNIVYSWSTAWRSNGSNALMIINHIIFCQTNLFIIFCASSGKTLGDACCRIKFMMGKGKIFFFNGENQITTKTHDNNPHPANPNGTLGTQKGVRS